MNTSAVSYFQNLGRRISQVSGYAREASYLYQRIAVITQRVNSVLFRDSFVAQESQQDDYYYYYYYYTVDNALEVIHRKNLKCTHMSVHMIEYTIQLLILPVILQTPILAQTQPITLAHE